MEWIHGLDDPSKWRMDFVEESMYKIDKSELVKGLDFYLTCKIVHLP